MSHKNPNDAWASRTQPGYTEKRKSRWGRRVLIGLGCLLLVVLLLVALAPTLISTRTGTDWALGFINDAIPGHVSIDKLNVAWFGGQSAEGVTVAAPHNGGRVVKVKRVDASQVTLWSLATGGRDFGTVKIIEPDVAVVQDEEGRISLLDAFVDPDKPDDNEPASPLPEDLRFIIEVEDAHVSYEAPQLEKVELDSRSARVELDHLKNLVVKLDADVSQKQEKGALDVDVVVREAIGATNFVQADKAQIEGKVQATKLPVAVADRLRGEVDQLTALLGPTLDVTVTARGGLQKLDAQVQANSERMDLTPMQLKIEQGKRGRHGALTVANQPTLKLLLTPQAVQAFVAQKEGEKLPAELVKPVQITVPLETFALPRNAQGQMLLASADVKVRVGLSEVQLKTPEAEGRPSETVTLRDAAAALTYTPQGRLTLTLDGTTERGGEPGRIGARIEIDNPIRHDLVRNKIEPDFKNMRGTVSASVTDFPTAMAELVSSDPLIGTAIGPKIGAQVQADLRPVESGADAALGVAGNVLVSVSSEHLNGEVSGSIDSARRIKLDAGKSVTLDATPQLLDKLLTDERFAGLKPVLERLRVAPGAALVLTINGVEAPLEEAGPANLFTDALLTARGITAMADPQTPIDLTDTNLRVLFNGPKNAATIALSARPTFDQQTARVQVNADVANLLNTQGEVAVPGATVTLRDTQVNNLFVAAVDRMIAQQNPQMAGVLTELLGASLSVDVAGTVKLAEAVEGYTGRLSLTSQSSNGNLTAGYEATLADGTLSLKPDAQTSLRVSPALAQTLAERFAPPGEGQPTLGLRQPATATLRITKLEAPLDAEKREDAVFGFVLNVDELAPAGDPKLAAMSLRNFNIALEPTSLNKPLNVTLNGQIVDGAASFPIEGKAEIAHAMDAEQRAVDAYVKVRSLPLALVDRVAQQDGFVTMVMGDVLDLVEARVTQTPTANDAIGFMVKVESARLNTDVSGTYAANDHVTIKENSATSLLVTPQALRAILTRGKPEGFTPQYELVKSTRFRVELGDAHIALMPQAAPGSADAPAARGGTSGETVVPTQAQAAAPADGTAEPTPPQPSGPIELPIDLRRTKLAVKLTNDETVLRDGPRATTVAMRGLTFELANADAGPAAFHVNLVADTETTRDNAEPATGRLESKTLVKNLTDAQGRLDPAQVRFSTDTRATDFSVGLIDTFRAESALKLVELVGPVANVEMVGDYARDAAAPLNLVFTAKYADATIPAELTPDGALALRQDAPTTLEMTEPLRKHIMRPINPFFSDAKAEERIKFTVYEGKLHVPIEALQSGDISQYKAVARLEVGTLDLRQSQLTKVLLGAIRAGGTDVSRVSFTPLDLNLENGVLKYDGLTMSIGPVVLGFGGQVRLEKEEYDLKITIPGKTLAAMHPSLSSAIGPNDKFVLPLTGTYDQPKLDTGAFVKEFAVLAARATGRKIGNDAIGDALDKILGGDKGGNPLDDLFKPKDK